MQHLDMMVTRSDGALDACVWQQPGGGPRSGLVWSGGGRQVMQCRAGVLGRHQAGNECGVAGAATSTREPRTISHARDWVN